eukprot:7382295-Prymnesium_polylepis.1
MLAAARRRENCEIMRPRLTLSTRNDPRRLPAHHGPLKPLPAPNAALCSILRDLLLSCTLDSLAPTTDALPPCALAGA